MGESDLVTQGQCDDRIDKVYGKLEGLSGSVNKMLGGIAVASFILVVCVGGVFYHFNYRFSDIEQSLDHISEKVESRI